MTLLAPLGLLAGLLVIPVVAMHILRPHRDPHPVSSTYLWRSLEEPVAAAQPWQRLRWTLPLLLHLLVVALLTAALARPALVVGTELADHTVFVIDASASMSATDGEPDRLEAAKDRIRELRGDLADGGAASLVVADATPEVLVAESTDAGLFERELDRIRPTVGTAEFGEAFTLAESLVSSTRSTGWVLLSDGGLTIDEQRLAPPGTRFEAVGAGDVNRAITSLVVTAVDGQLVAVVTIDNTGGPDAEQPLRVDVDQVTVDERDVSLPAGETVEVTVPIPPGSRVEAYLDGGDLLLLDNARAALAPQAQDLRVRVVSDGATGSFFVRQALDAMGATIVGDASDEVDLVVFDGVDVPPADATAQPVPFISIASPAPPAGLTVVGEVTRPVPTFLADDPLLDGVDITGTAIARGQALAVEAGTVLIGGAEGEPLVVAGRTGEQRWFHVAFRLEESNLPVAVAYPIMFTRMVTALTLADDVPASVNAGTRLPALGVDARVTSPRGVTTDVPAGSRMPVLDSTGFWTVQDGDGGLAPVAVVFPAAESRLAVPEALADIPAVASDTVGSAPGTTVRSLLTWVIAAALAVLVLELIVAWRQTGVGRGQFVAGVAVRTVIVLALLAALFDVGISRSNDDVRAVVVVDVSDSLGDDGRQRVAAFVDHVRAAAGSDSLAVVEVGRTAQVASPFGVGDDITDASPAGDATDLVRGLRLATSVLDGTTKQRVVLVSDGYDTAGGISDEVARLAELGIELDVHTVEAAARSDVAVTTLSAPTSVGENEQFTVVAEVWTSEAGTVTVDLLRAEEVVDSQDVTLAAGTNEVMFDAVAGDPGLERFSAIVRGAFDAVPQNDVSFAAVGVEGPPRVLVLDVDGDGGPIADALAARAVITDHRAVSAFPAADELTTFRAVVLVDVEADRLSADQVTQLDAFVREQGNGLIVVGGPDSFALGGYAETPLEDLLPVESRAEDPTRKASIAEVLLIDASESMGACHSRPVEGNDDPFAGASVEGGVSKTDISRSAAARAVEALSDQDEIGVLAFNGTQDWIIPLEPVSALGNIDEKLARLRPAGETRIAPALEAAAEGLRASGKELKHIVLFSDGFTPELVDDPGFATMPGTSDTGIVDLAAQLHDEEGMTISVVATGEGAAPLLEDVATAGGGRFYPGRDLEEIPEIFVEEVRIASRSFINEGEFLPTVTSAAAPVRGLTEAPAVAGYVATTPKDTTDVMLQVGGFADPLLSSWRVGLGRVTAWTSDAGHRWASDWASWPGWADFWSNVVRDTFPLEGAEGHQLRTRIVGDVIEMELVSDAPWPAGTRPVAHVALPDGASVEVELQRVDDTRLEGAVPAPGTGSYSIGVTTEGSDTAGSPNRIASSVASRSYPIEYRPPIGAPPDLAGMSERTGGRGEITADEVFDPDDLAAGTSTWRPRPLLLLLAALLLPLDIALRRVRLPLLIDGLRRPRRVPRPA